MNILLFLIPVSIVLMGLAIWAFVWAVRRGQFDDLDTPALDILREDVHDRCAPTVAPPNDGNAIGTSAGAEAGAGSVTGAHEAPPHDDASPSDPRRD